MGPGLQCRQGQKKDSLLFSRDCPKGQCWMARLSGDQAHTVPPNPIRPA